MTTKLLRSLRLGSPDYNHSRPRATHTAAPSGLRPHGDDTFTVSVAEDVYLQRLRGLGAWWRLGSSALEPLLLVNYAPTRRRRDPCSDS
jgi:hypothetical protein